jgi:hypothetical protein
LISTSSVSFSKSPFNKIDGSISRAIDEFSMASDH